MVRGRCRADNDRPVHAYDLKQESANKINFDFAGSLFRTGRYRYFSHENFMIEGICSYLLLVL